jgi:hypothetical protein
VIARDDHCIETRRRTDQPIVLSQFVVQVRGQQYTHPGERYQKKGLELELNSRRGHLILWKKGIHDAQSRPDFRDSGCVNIFARNRGDYHETRLV